MALNRNRRRSLAPLHRHRRFNLSTQSNLLVGLGAYWQLEEASGTRADVLGGSPLTDDINGVLGGNGIIGKGISVPAINGNFLFHADSATLGVGAGKSFTVSAWAQPSVLVSNGAIIGKWGSVNRDYIVTTDTANATVTASVFNLASVQVNISANFKPTVGVFFHVAYGYDDLTQIFWIQVNGGSRYQVSCVGVLRSAANFTIGNYDGGLAQTAFQGIIDEAAFWGRSLSSGEVIQLYNGGLANPYPFKGAPAADGYKYGTVISTYVATSTFTNGGAPITETKVRLIESFYNSLVALGLDTKMYGVYLFPSDSGWGKTIMCFKSSTAIGAATTSLNSGSFGASGVSGDSVGFYNTSLFGTDIASLNDSGFSIYAVSLTNPSSEYDFGYTDNAGSNMFAAKLKESGTTKCYITDITSSISLSTPGNGFYSANRSSSSVFKLYFASSSSAFSQVASTATAPTGVLQNQAMYLAATNAYQLGGAFGNVSNTYSFLAVHKSLSSTDSQNLFNLVDGFRRALGGGFV